MLAAQRTLCLTPDRIPNSCNGCFSSYVTTEGAGYDGSYQMNATFSRRDLLKSGTVASAACLLTKLPAMADESRRPRLRIAVKYTMIKIDGTPEEKLNLIKTLGFEGVEVDSPTSLNRAEVKSAS